MSDNPIENMKKALDYSRLQYGNLASSRGYSRPVSQKPEDVARRAELAIRITEAQPRLKQAMDAYKHIASLDTFAGKVAALHMGYFNPFEAHHNACKGCPGDDFGPAKWPCATAELVAAEYQINLEDMWMYGWEDQP